MASALNVIALISGGKDSFFSILHCQANGHNVIALANLHPAATKNGYDDDINSYMYQTVGHAAIPLYEDALGIPLYRQEITGKAVNSNKDYAVPLKKKEQDETEDLVPLLRKVMQAHPEANAVSTGAILSTYQRTRVESVAFRLGLRPLSYLWQYPLLPPYTQSSLLHDMSAAGQKAIIIKTASGGLDEEFLGLDVAAQRTILRLGKAMSRFGEADNGAILGEGGEFETLALEGPRPLWKKRIRVDNGPPTQLGGGQTVATIKLSTLEDKIETPEDDVSVLRIPELFDYEFKKILDLSDDHGSIISENATLVNEPVIDPEDVCISDEFPKNASSVTTTLFTFSNMTSDRRPLPDPDTSSRQLLKIFTSLDRTLSFWRMSKSSINHCTLLLRNMADFAVLNPVYANYFTDVNPPARVTISVGDMMPNGFDVMLSLIVDRDKEDKKRKITWSVDRQGLHVQGQSYWAPANIGPYSQAISALLPRIADDSGAEGHGAGEIVYVAGQIPLIPASMEVYQENGFKGQAVLSLQHLWRIGRSKGVRWWTAGVGFIPACTEPEELVCTAQAAWQAAHNSSFSSSLVNVSDEGEEEADIDPWDRINHQQQSTFKDTTYRAPIPDLRSVTSSSYPARPVPPCFIAQVAGLPRDVKIEWSATGLTSTPISFTRETSTAGLTITHPVASRSRFYTFEVQQQTDLESLLGLRELKEFTSATLYASRAFDGCARLNLRGVQWVPCERVWGEKGEVRGVFVGRVDQRDVVDEKLMGKFVSKLRLNSV